MYRDPRGGHNSKSININFFKVWNPQMAYVLGLIFSDGAVEDVRKSSRTCYFTITSVDISLLKQVKQVMSSSHTLYVRKPKLRIFPGGKKYLSAQSYVLRVGNKLMYQDLISLGLTPRKSLVLKFPNIPDEYLSHFVRGYFDGDGCIRVAIAKGRKVPYLLTIFTCGSKAFLETLSQKLASKLEINKIKLTKQLTVFRLRYRKHSSLKLLKFMYQGVNRAPYLDRKYAIYQNYLKSLN